LAGVDTRDDLADIFGLAPRLVDGLLGDLWRAGRISVDLGTEDERVRVTSGAKDELKEAEKGEGAVRSGSQRAHSENLAFERLTGRALPFFRTEPYPKDRRLVVPRMLDDPPATKLARGDLLEALTATLDRDGSEADGFKVDEAYLAPDVLGSTRSRRYVQLRVRVATDPAGDLKIQVVDDDLSLWQRDLATRRLQRLINDEPTSTFVKQLSQGAKREPLEERTLQHVMRDLSGVVSALEICTPAHRQQAHDRATYLARQIEAYANALVLREMDAEVIRTGSRHREIIEKMLEEATRQVVISAPWVMVRGVVGFRDSMLAAVQRGVRITLLWGIVEGPKALEPETLSALDVIHEAGRSAGRGGGLFFSRNRGSRIHAKVVAVDDRQLLVTSKNFLSGSDNDELGLFLEAVPGRPSPVIRRAPSVGDGRGYRPVRWARHRVARAAGRAR